MWLVSFYNGSFEIDWMRSMVALTCYRSCSHCSVNWTSLWTKGLTRPARWTTPLGQWPFSAVVEHLHTVQWMPVSAEPAVCGTLHEWKPVLVISSGSQERLPEFQWNTKSAAENWWKVWCNLLFTVECFLFLFHQLTPQYLQNTVFICPSSLPDMTVAVVWETWKGSL